MRMTSHTDYALRMLIYLALQPNRTCTINEVAQAYDISRNHLFKIAQALRSHGIISTSRGRAGGIHLIHSPEEINIGAIIRLTEEDFALVECMKSGQVKCAISTACGLKGMFTEAVSAYLAVLDKYTLADAIRQRVDLASLLDISVTAA